MTTVFVPVHRRMMKFVLERADLIEEREMPSCLLARCAHVNGYQAILKDGKRVKSPLNGKTTYLS
jgi:hypothetical protein